MLPPRLTLTELREIKQKLTEKQRVAAGTRARTRTVLRPPVWTGHSDFTNPFEFATFMRMAEGLEFDVMMEGKAKDLSILKLRPDLLRYAPDVAARFGIAADDTGRLTADEAALDRGVAADAAVDVDEGMALAAE